MWREERVLRFCHDPGLELDEEFGASTSAWCMDEKNSVFFGTQKKLSLEPQLCHTHTCATRAAKMCGAKNVCCNFATIRDRKTTLIRSCLWCMKHLELSPKQFVLTEHNCSQTEERNVNEKNCEKCC